MHDVSSFGFGKGLRKFEPGVRLDGPALKLSRIAFQSGSFWRVRELGLAAGGEREIREGPRNTHR